LLSGMEIFPIINDHTLLYRDKKRIFNI